MNALNIILGFLIYVSISEITVFLLVAVMLGVAIHFFIIARRTLPLLPESKPATLTIPEADEWRLKYLQEMHLQEKLRQQLQQKLEQATEKELLLLKQVQQLEEEVECLQDLLEEQPGIPVAEAGEAMENEGLELRLPASHNVQDSNAYQEHINRLLKQIEALKASQQQYGEIARQNEQLQKDVQRLQHKLAGQEAALKKSRHNEVLAGEMKERLNQGKEDFAALHERLQRLETNLAQSQSKHLEYEELQQTYFKLSKDFDDSRERHQLILEENQRLSRLMTDTEDKLRESNFQRQQLLKKVSFLEELNKDLQQVTVHHKKLQNQFKRISEIQSLLNDTANKQAPENTDLV